MQETLSAQNEAANPFVCTHDAARRAYAFSYGEQDSLAHYLTYAVTDVSKIRHGKQVVTYQVFRHQQRDWYSRSKANNEYIPVTIEQDTLHLTVAPLMGAGVYKHGYALKIPPTLAVGDSIESSTVRCKKKGKENYITFSDFVVAGEDTISVGKYQILCYRISGVMNGSIYNSRPLENTRYTLWVAPKVGLVQAQTDYYHMALRLK